MCKVPAYNFTMTRSSLLKETVELGQNGYAQTLYDWDAHEILTNCCAFFHPRNDWSSKERTVPPAPQAGGAVRSGAGEAATTAGLQTRPRPLPHSLQSGTRGLALAAISPMPAGPSVAVVPPSSNTGVTIPPKKIITHASKGYL